MQLETFLKVVTEMNKVQMQNKGTASIQVERENEEVFLKSEQGFYLDVETIW